MTPARLDQLNIVVRDMGASRAFYQRLGLDFSTGADSLWDDHHVTADTSDPVALTIDFDSTAFTSVWNEGWHGDTGVVLGFSVDSREEVDGLVARLAADGAPVQQEPYDAFWGARYAVVTDPAGNAVGIMSPIEEAFRSAPPPPP